MVAPANRTFVIGNAVPFLPAEKVPADILDFTLDYSQQLESGETISTSAWTSSGDLTVGTPASTHTTNSATVWLSAGTAANTYIITNTITTNQNREYNASFQCVVNQYNSVCEE